LDDMSPHERLKSLDLRARREALTALVRSSVRDGTTPPRRRDVVNMHCHTFFSYNAYGHSPSSLAWLAHEDGWHALATVDFDVLDGVDETLHACDLVGVRGASGLETRAYVDELADRVINSPGEPGICYHVGLGFAGGETPPRAARVLRAMREGAQRRNRDMLSRINAHLAPVHVDYDRDVLPLTPAGNATERHMLVALDAAARAAFPDRSALVAFWAEKLGEPPDAVEHSLSDTAGPNELIRSRLMKQGGVGYVPPDRTSFPPVDDVIRAIITCGAVPVVAWLDGTSEGERQLDALLDLFMTKGAAALTIIPERNWNIADPDERSAKVRELHRLMEAARSLDLPVLAGTEMNKPGQPLLDDFGAEPLLPYRDDFIAGANWAYGHTLLQRALAKGYQSDWARSALPNRGERNAFYREIGALVEPGRESVARVGALRAERPEAILAALGGGQAHSSSD